jgi:hypothetical protein
MQTSRADKGPSVEPNDAEGRCWKSAFVPKVLLALILVAGIGACSKSSGVAPFVYEHGGIRIEVSGGKNVSLKNVNGVISFRAAGLTGVVDHGAVTVNGKGYGQAKPGDTLTIDANNVVTIARPK